MSIENDLKDSETNKQENDLTPAEETLEEVAEAITEETSAENETKEGAAIEAGDATEAEEKAPMPETKVAVHEHKKDSRDMQIEKIIGGVTTGVSLIAFIIFGAISGLWHPGWVVLLLGGVVARIIELIVHLVRHRRLDAKMISEIIGGFVMSAAIILFVVFGLTKNLWHPAWVAFPAALIVSAVADIIVKSISGKKAE